GGRTVLGTEARYKSRRRVSGELVYVSVKRASGRDMKLEKLTSRAMLQGEIHELIVSSSKGLSPGAAVPDVAYIGFFEVTRGSMALAGDEVWVGPERLGILAGFDLTHFPNH